MSERPPTAPSDGALAETTTPPSKSSAPIPLPVTPPGSPGPRFESQTPSDTPNSRHSTRSHQEYLDSLKPPSHDEFVRLSSVQDQREKDHKRRSRELRHQSALLARQSLEAREDLMEETRHQHHHVHDFLEHVRSGSRHSTEENDSHAASIKSKAAMVIQRNYRGYRVRREMMGLGIDAGTRWTHAIKDAQWKEMNKPRPRGESLLPPGNEEEEGGRESPLPRSSTSTARQNWRKAGAVAIKAGNDEDSSRSDDESESSSDEWSGEGLTAEERAAQKEKRAELKAKRRKKAQVMGLQYFLEMVDLKHRYGSNLRQYHEQWKKSDTHENFFFWLDYGAGKNIELQSCPRDRLEREQVRYLNREERQHYLVTVDAEGRLCWAKNGVRIDTTEEWKDSIKGIVPSNDETPAFEPVIAGQTKGPTQPHVVIPDGHHSDDDASSISSSGSEADRAAKYATPTFDDASGVKKIKHVSAATIFNKLLRKSVKKNTWIFVADTSFRLYVGIKNSGAFQHSSFLQGSRISAAGLIKIKNGRLSSLSPLSGHYRPPTSNFRAFVHSLKDEGVDMSHVSISKSYAVLVGLEAYVKTRKKGKELVEKMTHRKEKLLDPEQVRKREEAERDKSESAEKERRFLEMEEAEREQNRAGVKFMQKFGLRPREPTQATNTGTDGPHE